MYAMSLKCPKKCCKYRRPFGLFETEKSLLYAICFTARNRERGNWIPTVWMMMKTKPHWNIEVFHKIYIDAIEVYLKTFVGNFSWYFVLFTAGGSGIHRPLAVPNRNMGQKAPGAEYRSKVVVFLSWRKCDLLFAWWNIKEWKNSTCCLVLVVIVILWF